MEVFLLLRCPFLMRTFLMKAYSIFDIQMCTFERNRVLFIDLAIYFLTF